jgi:hypothetical protein
VLLAALLALLAAAATDDPPLREVVVQGAQALSREQVLEVLRLRPGGRLRQDASSLARELESRYHFDGYPAARVAGSYDAASGVLSLEVDEGRLLGVEVEGASGEAAARVVSETGLAPGQVARDELIRDGLDRVGRVSEGALRADHPPYAVEQAPEGPTLSLRVRSRPARLSLLLRRVGTQSLVSRVDGLAPRLGVSFTLYDLRSYDHSNLYAQAAYGLESERVRFTLGARRSLGGGRLHAGYEWHDLTDTDDGFRSAGLEEPPTTVVAFSSHRDHYARRGHEAYAFLRLTPRAQAGVSFRADRHSSQPVVSDGSLFGSGAPRPNPSVGEGPMRSLLFTLRATSGEALQATRSRERDSHLLRNLYGSPLLPAGLKAEASLEWSSAEALGGVFTFTRLIGNLRGHRVLSPALELDGRLLLGLSSGQPPAQRRFALGGLGTLRGHALKAHEGRRMALATLELGLEPRPGWPTAILFWDGGAVWQPASGFRQDLGLGLRWPRSRRCFVRADAALPLDGGRARFFGRVTLPF